MIAGDAREIIQGAVFGLILLLGSWLILNTVNPQILDLATLRFERLQTSGEAKKVLDEYNREEAERKRRAQEFAQGTEVIRIGSNLYLGGVIENSDELGFFEKNKYFSACRSQGRVLKETSLGGCVFSDGSIRRDDTPILCGSIGAKPVTSPSLLCVTSIADD